MDIDKDTQNLIFSLESALHGSDASTPTCLNALLNTIWRFFYNTYFTSDEMRKETFRQFVRILEDNEDYILREKSDE